MNKFEGGETPVGNESDHNQVKWVVVHEAGSETEAEIIKSRLQAAGIPVFVNKETASWLYGVTTGPLAGVKVLVPNEHQKEAQAILSTELPQ